MTYPESVQLTGQPLELKSFLTKKKFSDYSWLTFPLVLFWLIGVGTGIYISKTYFNYKLIEAVKMNRIMIQTVVYDLMPYDSAMGQVKK